MSGKCGRDEIIAAIDAVVEAIGSNIPDADLAGKIGRVVLLIYVWPGKVDELPPETRIKLDLIRSWPGTGVI